MAERVREVVPEPVLEVVHEREEERCDECGRDADRRAEQHEVEVIPTADFRRRGAGGSRLGWRGRVVGHWATERVPATIEAPSAPQSTACHVLMGRARAWR